MKYWLRAIGVGLTTTVSTLLAYQVPPTLEQWWQPVLLGVQAAIAQGLLNKVSKGR